MRSTTLGGRPTSRIGMGCGRLTGGASLRVSCRLVEQARDLGIQHFDTAPSYGLGTSEDVLGQALAGDNEVTIASKVGIERPSNAGAKALVRHFLRPLLSSAPGLKARLASKTVGATARRQFDPMHMRTSFDESLRRLRRDCVDALMLHQPDPEDLNDAVLEAMTRFIIEGRVGAIGSGTGRDEIELIPLGTVSQFRFELDRPASVSGDVLLHGALRRYSARPSMSAVQQSALRELGRDTSDPSTWIGCLLTLALTQNPKAIIIISSNSASRLKQACKSIDWSIVDNPTGAKLSILREAIQ